MTIFDSESLQKEIDNLLLTIPDKKKGAFVCTITPDRKVIIRVATKVGDNWSIGGVVYHGKEQEWNKGWEPGVYITGSW